MKITNEQNDIKQVLFTEEKISARVKEIGAQITGEYKDKAPVVACILKGASFFPGRTSTGPCSRPLAFPSIS